MLIYWSKPTLDLLNESSTFSITQCSLVFVGSYIELCFNFKILQKFFARITPRISQIASGCPFQARLVKHFLPGGRLGRWADDHTTQFRLLEGEPGGEPERHHHRQRDKRRPAAMISGETQHQIAPLCGASEMKGTPKKVANAMT